MLKTTLPHCFLIFLLAILPSIAKAQQDTASSIALSQELNKLQMYELSLYLIKTEMSAHPADKDLYLVQEAQICFATKKADKAWKIINGIPKSSKAYGFSRYIMGVESVKLGKYKEGVKALEEYFVYIKKHLPKKEDKAEVQQFVWGVGYLKEAYTQQKQPDDAAKAAAYMAVLRDYWDSLDGSDQGASPQEKQFQKTLDEAEAKLNALERMKMNGEKINATVAAALIKPLESVFWAGGSSEYATRGATLLAKTYWLLGRYQDGLTIMGKYAKSTQGFDDWYKKQKRFHAAPSARAYLWRGFCNLGLGDKAKAKDDKIKYYFTAAKRFLFVLIKYDVEKCIYAKKAVAGFNMAKDSLAREGKILKMPKKIKLPKDDFVSKSADDKFAKGKYAEAIPLYLNLLHSKGVRTSPKASEFLFRLAFAYLKTGAMIEALTIADYLADYFPDAPNTPRALLGVGQLLWKKYKVEKNPAEKEKYLQDALTVYDSYLANCPTDEYADEISSRVAKVYYDKASELALEANKMPNGPAKAEKAEEARAAFKRTIPLYKRIMDNYLHTDMGKSSAYLLAWCYSNSRQYGKSADVFLKFADAEAGREKKEKINWGLVADAKLRAAQNYIQFASALEKEAKQLKQQAETAPKAGSAAAKADADGKTPATEESLLDSAKKNEAEAIKYYKLGVQHVLDLVGKWTAPKGRLTNAKTSKDKKKIAKVRADAYGLLPWAYDGARDNKKAIAAFTDYIKRYPRSKGKAKSMSRLGMLYIEEDKPNEAAQVFKTLTNEFPEEGKKVLPKMARTMYKIEKYDKCIEAVQKLFSKAPIDASVSDLRWIATNLPDCGGTHPKAAAKLALKACELLNAKLDKPVWKDWVGKNTVKLIAADPKQLKKWTGILREQLLFMTGSAAYWAGEYKKAADALSRLLLNQNTPYLVDGHFLRAEACRKLKKPQAALDEDYNPISFFILGSKGAPTSLYYRVQCSIGDTYLEMNQTSKAAGAYGLVDMAVQATTDDGDAPPVDEKKKESPEEKKLQADWIEYALFMDICCKKKLGKKDDLKRLKLLYRKHYPAGRFKSKLDSPPSPGEAMKQSPEYKK